MSGGRQMVYHLDMPEVGVLPVQSPVGMQLGKAAGYALGFRKGRHRRPRHGHRRRRHHGRRRHARRDERGERVELPVIIMVTDNGVAISTRPDEGRGIKDFGAYAELRRAHFSCDGRTSGTATRPRSRAARVACTSSARCSSRAQPAAVQRPLLRRRHDLRPRPGRPDHHVWRGARRARRLIEAEDASCAAVPGTGRDFFAHHELGRVMGAKTRDPRQLIDQVRASPTRPGPSPSREHLPPFPARSRDRARRRHRPTVTYAGAIRSALDKLIIAQARRPVPARTSAASAA
jgi:hypothetical protein